MIITFDTETKGLEATPEAFIMGVICYENLKTEVFDSPRKMWNKIIEIAEKQARQGKNLIAYAHNARYDYYTIGDLEDKETIPYSDKAFILNRGNLKISDSMLLFPMGLEKVGKILGYEKTETPQCLKEGREPTFQELGIITKYCEQDTRVLMKAIQQIKKTAKEDGLYTRRLISIGQIAMANFIQYIRKNKNKDDLIIEYNNPETRRQEWKIIETKYDEEISKACRGGRVQAYTTGYVKKANYIDVNSLYPYSATIMKFPDLRTEKRIEGKANLNKIGITFCKIEIKEQQKIGFLPIRIETEDGENNNENTIYPKNKGTIMIGSWTNIELKEAEKRGYEIKEIYYSIQYEEVKENPLKKYMENLYEKRMKEQDEFRKHYYKSLMNQLTGKFLQKNEIKEKKWDSVEKYNEYKEEGYEVTEKAIGTEYLYEKTIKIEKAKWYIPIIYAYITATSRIHLYKQMEKLKLKGIHYNDTDSIIFTGKTETFKYSNNLGDFKLMGKDQELYIYGKKSYIYGEEIKLSGANKDTLNKKDFMQGKAEIRRMTTQKTAKEKKDIGKFKITKLNLKEKLATERKREEKLQEKRNIIDKRNYEEITKNKVF